MELLKKLVKGSTQFHYLMGRLEAAYLMCEEYDLLVEQVEIILDDYRNIEL